MSLCGSLPNIISKNIRIFLKLSMHIVSLRCATSLLQKIGAVEMDSTSAPFNAGY
jgi:hypothetical protein